MMTRKEFDQLEQEMKRDQRIADVACAVIVVCVAGLFLIQIGKLIGWWA